MKALKDILIECSVCHRTDVKYNDAYRKPDVKGDMVIVSYVCCECEEKEYAEKK